MPAGAVDDVDHRLGGGAVRGTNAGTPVPEPPVERFTRVGHVAGGDHRARDLRPADRPAGLAARLLRASGSTSTGTPSAASRAPIASTRAIRAVRWAARNAASALVARIEEVAEHVDVASVLDGGDLDAADGLDAALARRRLDLVDSRRRVVIGDGHDRDAAALAACSTSSRGVQRPSEAVV